MTHVCVALPVYYLPKVHFTKTEFAHVKLKIRKMSNLMLGIIIGIIIPRLALGHFLAV